MIFTEVHLSSKLLDNNLLVALLQNTAILLSLSLLYGSVWLRRERRTHQVVDQILAGITIGAIAFVLMKTPWILTPGLVFDTRSVLLSVSGFYFGAVPTVIAIMIAGAVRIADGGDGMWMGLSVIISSGTLGIIWGRIFARRIRTQAPRTFLFMGLVVHLFMLIFTSLLPTESIFPTMKILVVPLLTIYTPATMLLGMLLLHQKRNHENRQSADQLFKSELRFKELFENHAAVKLIINPENGAIVNANNAASKFYGWSPEEIKGMKISEINTLPQEKIEQKIDVVLNRERIHFEFQHRKKDGSEVDVEVFCSKIEMEEKTYLHSIIHDVSEKKQLMKDLVIAKEQAEESDRLKTMFLMNMSHEIRTPLNGILGFASILMENHKGPEETKEFAEIIFHSGQRLLSLINDIIDISRIEAGVLFIDNDEVCAKRAMLDAMQGMSSKAMQKGLTIFSNSSWEDDPIYIQTDAGKLNQILTNLIGNAIKFSDSGIIETGCFVQDHAVVLFVKDQGIGIPDEFHDKVFNRFFQVKNHLSADNPGTGLGLAISKGLAELLKGSIWFESQTGSGSAFYLKLPVLAADTAVPT
jgi:PAS domain S-box-containing protein